MKRNRSNHINNRHRDFFGHSDRLIPGTEPDRAPKGGNKRKSVLAVCSLLLVFTIIGIAAFTLDGKISSEKVRSEDAEEMDDKLEMGGGELSFNDETYFIRNKFDTFLFMGTDYSGNEEGTGEDYQGSLSDFLMLLVIDHTEDTYAFLPIDRNTMTDVSLIEKDGSGEAMAVEQICTAHWYGGSKEMGCENTVTAVSDYLGGLDIDAYYAISMSEIPRINHEIGGVTVTLKEDFTDMDPEMKPGATLTLTDEQAEIYLHSRMNMADDTNVNRMERQRTYMAEALKKIKDNLRKDPDYYKKVSDDFAEVATSSVTGRQTSRIANAMVKYEGLGTFDIEGETRLGTELGDGLEHEEFYPDPDSVLRVMTSLYHLEKEGFNNE